MHDSGKSFAIQFPDSNIAENYKMEETKAKYFPIWDIPAFTFYVAGRYEEHAIHVPF